MFKRTFFLFLSLVLFSCNSSSQSSKMKKNVLRINFQSEPSTLDPRKGKDLLSSSLFFMLFEGLTRSTPESSAQLALAEKVDLSPDGKTYTFYLREAKWSDGSPLQAYDFEAAWKESLSPDFPSYRPELFYPIKNAKLAKQGKVSLREVGIIATNPKTLVVELEHPAPYFLQLIASPSFLPIPHRHALNHPDWIKPNSPHFICNGPFTFESWKLKRHIHLKKNHHYRKASSVSLSGIAISLVSDEATALNMYHKGELDLLGNPLSYIPLDALTTLIQEKKVFSSPMVNTVQCIFNTKAFPFHNLHMRKAFAYAINRQAIVEHVTKSGEIIATGIVSPILKSHSPHHYRRYKDGDFTKAREHLKKGLEELNINLSELGDLTLLDSIPISKTLVQALQQQWKEALGVEVKIEGNELSIYLDKLERKDYQMTCFPLAPRYEDSMGMLTWFKHKENRGNFPGWENQSYIQLLDASNECNNSKEREEILEKAETILIDEQPVAPIYFDVVNSMQKPYLKGVYISPKGIFYFENAYFEKR